MRMPCIFCIIFTLKKQTKHQTLSKPKANPHAQAPLLLAGLVSQSILPPPPPHSLGCIKPLWGSMLRMWGVRHFVGEPVGQGLEGTNPQHSFTSLSHCTFIYSFTHTLIYALFSCCLLLFGSLLFVYC